MPIHPGLESARKLELLDPHIRLALARHQGELVPTHFAGLVLGHAFDRAIVAGRVHQELEPRIEGAPPDQDRPAAGSGPQDGAGQREHRPQDLFLNSGVGHRRSTSGPRDAK